LPYLNNKEVYVGECRPSPLRNYSGYRKEKGEAQCVSAGWRQEGHQSQTGKTSPKPLLVESHKGQPAKPVLSITWKIAVKTIGVCVYHT